MFTSKRKIFISLFFLVLFVGLVLYFFQSQLFTFRESDTPVDIVKRKSELLLGEIDAVHRNYLILKREKMNIVPLLGSEQEFDLLSIRFGKDTKVYKYTNTIKTKEQFFKDQELFNNKYDNSVEHDKKVGAGEDLSWFVKEETAIDGLAKGQIAKISAVKQNSEYIAKKIIIAREEKYLSLPSLEAKSQETKIVGVIKTIKDNSIQVQVLTPSLTADFEEEMIKDIIIDNNTTIIKKIEKSAEQFQKEQAEYNKKINFLKAAGEEISNINTPSWYIEQEVALDNLAVGQDITLIAVEDKANGHLLAKRIEYIAP